MRVFIAIPLPLEIKDVLAGLQEKLKKSGADVKWVEPANIHLTLKFLGERDEKKIKQITDILEEVARNKKQFAMRMRGTGAFPSINSARVIWAGIELGEEEVKSIAQELEEKIARIGIPKEDRPFSCHITIGRTRSNRGLENLAKELLNLKDKFGGQEMQFLVRQISLYQSTLTPKGPTYTTLKTANLATT
jgi:2'-5' RNA ligase